MDSRTANVDVGNLLVNDTKALDLQEFKTNTNEYFKRLCQDGTQLLINEIFNLPVEIVDDVYVVKLTKGTTQLPREKKLPKAKAPTKWEQYAQLKGIQKKKKTRMVFDETNKEYRPRYGYKRANDSTKDWLIEVPAGEKNDDKDFFSERTKAKNERVAKNELQRLRNMARSKHAKVRGISLLPNDKPDKLALSTALHAAKRSDASMSKFSEKLPDEDKKTKGLNKKRKFESNLGDSSKEKEKQMKIFSKIISVKEKASKEKLDIDKAVNVHLATEEEGQSKVKKMKAGSGGKKRNGGNGGKKPFSGKKSFKKVSKKK